MKVHSEGNSALVEEIILIVTIIVKDQHVNCLMRHVLRYLVGGVSLAFIYILRTEKKGTINTDKEQSPWVNYVQSTLFLIG